MMYRLLLETDFNSNLTYYWIPEKKKNKKALKKLKTLPLYGTIWLDEDRLKRKEVRLLADYSMNHNILGRLCLPSGFKGQVLADLLVDEGIYEYEVMK